MQAGNAEKKRLFLVSVMVSCIVVLFLVFKALSPFHQTCKDVLKGVLHSVTVSYEHYLTWQGFYFSPSHFQSHNIPVVQHSTVPLIVLNRTSFFQLSKYKDHLKLLQEIHIPTCTMLP